MNNGKIFVVNFSGHNIEKAFDYTNIDPIKAQINLTEGNVDIFDLDRLIYVIKQKVRDSKPTDFLLLSGSVIINAIAVCQWLEKHGLVRLLIYHMKKKKYILRELTHTKMYIDL